MWEILKKTWSVLTGGVSNAITTPGLQTANASIPGYKPPGSSISTKALVLIGLLIASALVLLKFFNYFSIKSLFKKGG